MIGTVCRIYWVEIDFMPLMTHQKRVLWDGLFLSATVKKVGLVRHTQQACQPIAVTMGALQWFKEETSGVHTQIVHKICSYFYIS